jgi:hypothetical protein
MKTTPVVVLSALMLVLAGGGLAAVLADEAAELAEEAARAPGDSGQENLVSRNESVACDDACVDSFEVRCTQNSHSLCVFVTDNGAPDDPLAVSYVATVPAAILGQADIDFVAAGGSRNFCFLRPAADGLMRGLVTVTSQGAVLPATYQIQAECRNSMGVTKNTTITRRQNQ